mgnify:CR=1 FL=1
MSLLEVKNLKKVYTTRFSSQQVTALSNVSFSVEEGEYVAIMGESGSGKTTLLNILASQDTPTSGEVLLNGEDITKISEKHISQFRRKNLGFVFQDFNLMDSLSVKENIMLPVLLDKKEQKECEEKAEALEKQFGIEHLQEKNPYELSGGERQRVAICRALINDPSIIFADEPTGNLDSKSGKVVAEEFRKINEELGKTLLMVTHDPQMASRCKRVIFLKDGYVMNDVRKEGTEEEFYRTIIGEMEKF